jgi:ABC-type nitrate/sulfonate/bicarbonate transport system substrate-binding protein
MTKGKGVLLLAVLIVACGGAAKTVAAHSAGTVAAAAPTIPQVTIKFGNAEFIDHTDAILGVERGWFKDVGITLDPKPAGGLYTPSEHAAVLLSKRVDVQSSNYQILLPALGKTKELRCFAYGDFFIGFAMMGKKQYKSFAEFRAKGQSTRQALRSAVAQMKGRTLTWSPDPAVRNFGRTVMLEGGVGLGDVKQESLDDAQGVQLMLAGRADFQIGGAPTRATLEKAGFKPIVTAADLTGLVKQPFASSKVLSAVSTNGWCTTLSYWKAHPDTILRMASVKWRISGLIAKSPNATAPTHVKFLNRAAGTNLSVQDAKVIYRSIDPYVPFNEQGKLWFTPGKPTYELTMIQAAINQAVATKVLKVGAAKPEDVTIAHLVYKRAVQLKGQADRLMGKVNGGLPKAPAAKRAEATKLLASARKYYGWYDFVDAVQFAQAAQAALR